MYPYLKKNIVLVDGPQATGIYDLNNGSFHRVTLEAGSYLKEINGLKPYSMMDIEEQEFIDHCSSIKLLDFLNTPSQQRQTQLNEVVKERRPVKFAWLELTSRCNQLCLHCFVGDQLNQFDNVSKDKLFEYIDILVEHGVKQLVISGGEPTIHPDFEEIIDYIGKTKCRISVLSNGSHSKIPNYIDCFVRNDVVIKIPLLGWEKSHDEMAGVNGCFEKTIINIKKLIQNNVDIQIGTTVTSINYDDIEKIRDFANSLEIELEVSPIYSIGWATKNKDKLLNIPMDSVLKKCKDDKDKIIPLNKKNTTQNRPNKYPADPSDYESVNLNEYLTSSYECGQKIIAIQSNGNVTACLLLREDQHVMGNVNENSLSDIINGTAIPNSYSETMKLSNIKGCSQCEARFVCKAGGCPASSYALAGSVMSKNPLYDKCYYVNKISVINEVT